MTSVELTCSRMSPLEHSSLNVGVAVEYPKELLCCRVDATNRKIEVATAMLKAVTPTSISRNSGSDHQRFVLTFPD
jgi:hypothetical protein